MRAERPKDERTGRALAPRPRPRVADDMNNSGVVELEATAPVAPSNAVDDSLPRIRDMNDSIER